jgi:hypothetical protein
MDQSLTAAAANGGAAFMALDDFNSLRISAFTSSDSVSAVPEPTTGLMLTVLAWMNTRNLRRRAELVD